MILEAKIDGTNALAGLAHLEHATQDMTPLARSISIEFLSQTEANLEAEGRPQWLGLKASTIESRTRRGTWPGKIMQESGRLAASFTPGYDSDSAWIGSIKKYAAIQHAGGQAGRGKKVKIEARPSIPADAQGNMQPEAERAVVSLANNYLKTLIR